MSNIVTVLQNKQSPEDVAKLLKEDRLNQVDGKGIAPDERSRLEAFNALYTHTLLAGKHYISRQKYSAAEGMITVFEPLSEFKNYFLHEPKIAGMNAGKAWLYWAGKNYKPGGVTFQPHVEACPEDAFNMWQGYKVQPEEGDCKPYLNHIRQAICGGSEPVAKYLLQWLAHTLQKPDQKPSVAVLLKSVEGTGKGTMVRPLAQILGQHFVALNGDEQLTGKFNSVIANRLLVFADEVKLTDHRKTDRLKAIISEPTVSMERKGIDPEPVPNFARFIFASNHDHVLLAGQRERRYLVLEPDANYAGNEAHFRTLYEWLNRGGSRYLLHYLLNVDISDFDPHRAPKTQGLIDEKLQSMKPVQQWFFEWIEKSRFDVPPFPCRMEGAEMAKKYRDWSQTQMHSDMPQKSAETQIGNLMKAMNIQKTRHDKNRPRVYEFHPIEEMQKRFAGLLGETVEVVFTET